MHRYALQLAAALALTAASVVTAGAYPPGRSVHSYLGAMTSPTLVAAMKAMPTKINGDAVEAGDLEIKSIWARAMLPGQPTGAGYLTVTNSGAEADRLISASSPAAGRVQIHSMKMKNGIMEMRPVAGGLEIPAGGKIELKPGSFHIMFMDLGKRLEKGGVVPLTLEFQKAGKVKIMMPVEAANAKGAAGSMGGMKMN